MATQERYQPDRHGFVSIFLYIDLDFSSRSGSWGEIELQDRSSRTISAFL